MARLKDNRTGPPGGWRYVQPDTGCEIRASSFPELAEQVIQHRAYKGINPKDAESVIVDIERQLCSGLEPRFCTAEKGEDFQPIVDTPMALTMAKVTAGTAALLAFVKNGGELVSKEESARRAKICQGCRYNRQPDGCGACGLLFSMVAAIIPANRSENVKACAVCGCMLKAKVLMPAVVLEASNAASPATYPAHCWQNTL